MSHRTAARLAWSLLAVCVVLIVLALVLDFMTSEVILPRMVPTWARTRHRRTNGDTLASVPGGRGAHRLAASGQPHGLDFLWLGLLYAPSASQWRTPTTHC